MVKVRRALVAGCGGAVVAATIAVGGWFLLPLPLEPYDTIAGGTIGTLPLFGEMALAVGVIAGGAALGVVYAFVFEFVTRRAGLVVGALLGVASGGAAWLGVGLGAWFFPGVAMLLPAEVSMLFNSLPALSLLVVAHAAYGATVGAWYRAPIHKPDAVTRVMWREVYPTEKELN